MPDANHRIFIDVRTADFDPGAELERLRDPAHGAIASFVGIVRDFSATDAVDQLVIEHYSGMTQRVLGELAEQACTRWPLGGVSIIHRVGTLEAGDRIVWVGVSSRHREAAFDACRFLIDRLKTDAPFWKQERGSKGARWVESRAQDSQAASAWDAPAADLK